MRYIAIVFVFLAGTFVGMAEPTKASRGHCLCSPCDCGPTCACDDLCLCPCCGPVATAQCLRIHLCGGDPYQQIAVDLPQFAAARMGGEVVEPVCVVPGLKAPGQTSFCQTIVDNPGPKPTPSGPLSWPPELIEAAKEAKDAAKHLGGAAKAAGGSVDDMKAAAVSVKKAADEVAVIAHAGRRVVDLMSDATSWVMLGFALLVCFGLVVIIIRAAGRPQ